MKNNEPYLLIELNDKNFIFFVVQFNENGEFKLLDTIIEISKGILCMILLVMRYL